MATVHVLTPYSKPYNAQYWKSFITAFANSDLNLIHKDVYGLPIDIARNYLIDCYKTGKADFLLWVDSDCSYPKDAITRLVNHDLPMVCGCMYTRDGLVPKPTMGRLAGKSKEGKVYYRMAETGLRIVDHAWGHDIWDVEENAVSFPETGVDLWEIDGCGLHFTLVRRDVIEKVKPPYHMMLGKSGAGEDFYFSKKVKEAGFPIYVDLGLHTGHCLSDTRDVGIKEFLEMAGYLKHVGIQFTDVLPEVSEVG